MLNMDLNKGSGHEEEKSASALENHSRNIVRAAPSQTPQFGKSTLLAAKNFEG
jgi:hypothetical protein